MFRSAQAREKIPSFSLSYSRVLNSLSPLRSSWQALNVEYYPLRLGVFSLSGVLCARKKELGGDRVPSPLSPLYFQALRERQGAERNLEIRSRAAVER